MRTYKTIMDNYFYYVLGDDIRRRYDHYRITLKKEKKMCGSLCGSCEKKKKTSFFFPRLILSIAVWQVEDPDRVFVHVALGFHVEFTLSEAISFSDVKRSSLASSVANLKEREAGVAKDVVLAESMVQELRALAASER